MGAITGIIVGEMELLHSSSLVNSLAGIITFISALLVNILPEMTQKRMPQTLEEIKAVQFENKTSDNVA